MSRPTAAPTAQRLRASPASKALLAWFEARGWKPFAFQREMWRVVQGGRSGLLHATTRAERVCRIRSQLLSPNGETWTATILRPP